MYCGKLKDAATDATIRDAKYSELLLSIRLESLDEDSSGCFQLGRRRVYVDNEDAESHDKAHNFWKELTRGEL